MIFRIAFKNIWRNKVRSLIVITAVALGLAGGIMIVSIITGLMDQKIRSGINIETSHLQIHQPEYLKNYDAQYSIPGADSVAAEIRHMPGVKAVTSRIRFMGMAASAESATGVQIVGVDPESEKTVSTLYGNIPDSCGSYFTGSRKNQVVIGHELAQKLKIRLKSKMVIRFQDISGNLSEAAFTVTGIYRTSNSFFDYTNVFVKKTDLASLTGSGTRSQEIAVMLMDIKDIPVVEPLLKKRFPGLEVLNWMELRPDMAFVTSAISIEVYVLLGIILFALAFGIVNTMLMIVFERTRELGMLMAVGMSKSRVFSMIMLETIFLTLLGGAIGIALSVAGVIFFHNHGIDLSAFSKGLEAYGIDSKIYPFITKEFYINVTIMVLSTGILSAIAPARRALKLKPVEAIRVE